MSCRKNSNRINHLCATKSAISAAGSKAGNVAGTVISRTDQTLNAIGQGTAPVTKLAMKVVGASDNQTKAAAQKMGGSIVGAGALALLSNSRTRTLILRSLAATGTVSGAAAKQIIPYAKFIGPVTRIVDNTSSAIGGGIGALSKTGKAGKVTFTEKCQKRKLIFFKEDAQRRVSVSLWKSGLTALINRRDMMFYSGQNIKSNQGTMFEVGNKTWHHGTTTFSTPTGQERTITHLQSMSLPTIHYYFDRPVSGKHAVGIAAQKTSPEKVPGFAGQVSRTESLLPTWSHAKQTVFKAHIHWAEKG